MASPPILTVLEKSHISPPPSTIGDRSLPLSFFDIAWLPQPPVHHLFFYDFPLLSPSHFIQTIVPTLKNSLSTTLQHFFPFAGNLIIYDPTTTKSPEIRYVEGDSVVVTIAESSSLDFEDLVGNHPRDCDKFYPLIPPLGQATKVLDDQVKIPVFSIQVTLFPTRGISIGITNSHCLGDASTRFCFLEAWSSIARSRSDSLTLPLYDRVIKHPELDEIYLKQAKVETFFSEDYQPRCLSEPSDHVRVTLVLTRSIINQMKKWVSTDTPTLTHVSSFILACAYVWICMAKVRNDNLEAFGFVIDCRARLSPAIPATYFGNCVAPCVTMAKTNLLTDEKEGFVTAVKLLGDSLHKMVNDKEGIMKDAKTWYDFSIIKEWPTTVIGVAGTPKLKFYETDFGWGKPKKYETVSIDYSGSISLNTTKESNEDLEIGFSLSRTEMEAFMLIFNQGLQNYMI